MKACRFLRERRGVGRTAGAVGPCHVAAAVASLAALLVAADAGEAVVVSGSSRTAVYTRESRLGAADFGENGDLEQRTELLQHLRFDVLGIGSPGLSFHTAFSARNVLTDESARDTRFRFQRGYLQAAAATGAMRYQLRLGRQWVLAGVGSGIADAVSVQATRADLGDAILFFGTLGTDRIASTDRFWSLDSPDDSYAAGGRLRYRRSAGALRPELAVSFVEVERTYGDERVADARRLGLHGSLRMRTGGGASSLVDDLRLYGELRRELLDEGEVDPGNRSATAGVELFGTSSGARAWLEYDWRRPDLGATSRFLMFPTEARNALRGGVGMSITEDIRADLDADLVRFEDDEEAGAALMVSGYGLAAGYRFHGGYGGDLAGLVLYGHRDLGERLAVDLSVNHMAYEYGESDPTLSLEPVDDTATAGILALAYRLLPALTLTGQVEAMENARFEHDVRFLGIAEWRFRAGQ